MESKNLSFLDTTEYREKLVDLALSIRRGSETAENEATVVSVFEINLFAFLSDHLGIKYYPQKEKLVNTERHITKGRIDSKYGGFIIEFKHPSKLKTKAYKDSAEQQLTDYLSGLYAKNQNDYLGLVTDGIILKFIRCEHGKIYEEAWGDISDRYLDRIIRSILILDLVALNSKNLVKDFCEPLDCSLSKRLAKILFDTLNNKATGKTLMLFEEWRELFRLAHNDKSKQLAIEERRYALGKSLGIKIKTNAEEYLALYSLQTAYAIIIKIIAYKVTSKIKFKKNIIQFNELAVSNSSVIQKQMEALEDGAVFRSLGITNLLEGDFFSWYASPGQWSDDIYEIVKETFHTLTKYEDKILSQEETRAQDLFKELYEQIIPLKVRHSLGEFYTPAWLADHLVTETIEMLDNKPNWRGLDPCAGSGTFITVLIEKIINEEASDNSKENRLKSILNRVKAIDLNPLAVLTCRINYFINIAHLITDDGDIEIPVYLGDSSYVPEETKVSGVDCLNYKIKTLKGYLDVTLPKSAVADSGLFSRTMTAIEQDIKALDEKAVFNKIVALVNKADINNDIISNIQDLSSRFVELEKNEWNGIWARIVTNFLTTANLGKFDLIVGNPPWIDWKSLPEGYRERVKSLCIERHLFSGDGITGGINLNICALIANVAVDNWLKKDGVLSFLMPQNLLFQQTYEGFRNFYISDGTRFYFQKIVDWTGAGHPFKPVQHKFLTYFISSNKTDYKKGINLEIYKKNTKKPIEEINHYSKFENVKEFFIKKEGYLGQCNDENTAFTYANNKSDIQDFNSISGSSYYLGREGIEFYPQELLLFKADLEIKALTGKVYLNNYQNQKSKYKIGQQTILVEKEYLHPLIKGVDIERYHLNTDDNYVVPFPYDKEVSTRVPLNLKILKEKSPLLATYFVNYKKMFENQTEYNAKIIGKKEQEFYALARVGAYSFARNYVCFRDNTKWQAVVVSDVDTEWGGVRHPLFQNHAVSICEDAKGGFITIDEAHFICAILNAPITQKFVLLSSDSRTFKIRPPVYIPKYDPNNSAHKALVNLSKEAHLGYKNDSKMRDVDKEVNRLYLQIAKENNL